MIQPTAIALGAQPVSSEKLRGKKKFGFVRCAVSLTGAKSSKPTKKVKPHFADAETKLPKQLFKGGIIFIFL